MTTTTHFALTNDEWRLVADGQTRVAVQLRDSDVRLHVGQSAPDVATNDYFAVNGQTPASMDGLTASDKVYARSHRAGTANIVVMAGSGE